MNANGRFSFHQIAPKVGKKSDSNYITKVGKGSQRDMSRTKSTPSQNHQEEGKRHLPKGQNLSNNKMKFFFTLLENFSLKRNFATD